MRVLFILCVAIAVAVASHETTTAPTSKPATPEGPFHANFFSGYAAARRGYTEDAVLWQKGFGSLDVRGTMPMPMNARFPIASNTKLLVAVALYQLQEQGFVDLSQPVQNYLNETDMAAFGLPGESNWCPTVKGSNDTTCRNVTFVQLLAMQAGIPNQHLLPAYYPYLGSIASAFGLFIKSQLEYEPGTTFYYSNPAFILAGYFVEKFSGMRLADYLRVNIFDVIGMKDSYFDVFNNQFALDERRIEEYTTFADPTLGTVVSKAPCTVEFDIGLVGGAGGVIGTPQDEARFYYTLFNFSSEAMGKPLLQDPRSLLAIVNPRTFITAPLFFGQGIIVEAANATSFPTRAQYVGGLYCPRTANFFELVPPGEVRVPLMTQAWSNGPTFFANLSTWSATQRAQVGIFQEIVGGPGWGVREGNNDLAIGVFNFFHLR